MRHRLRHFITATFVLVAIGAVGLFIAFRWWVGDSNSNDWIGRWLRNPQANAQLESAALTRCGAAPFILPTQGFIGLLWADTARPYTPLRRHTGIDIFGNGAAGTIPIYAVYDGYLSRLDDWVSTVIIRHDDPLQAGRDIWTYYTHMASLGGESYIVADFPQGTYDHFVEQGTLLGYQGLYSPGLPIAMHLHFSIVTSAPDGSFRNEAILENTLDPSPYFGLQLNADTQKARPVTCRDA